VLGNEDARALPVIKIVPTHEFYDFESKYAVGGSQHICPAPLSEELTRKAQDLAVAAHNALECRGVSRTDMLLDAEGTFWVLETNTIPGMTNTSLLPDAARVVGLDYPALCTKMIEDALAK
jgi:D-alanine-D-alanine ligase